MPNTTSKTTAQTEPAATPQTAPQGAAPHSANTSDTKAGLVRLLAYAPPQPYPLALLRPAPINDRIYKPVLPTDPDILKLADDISKNGVMTALQITLDGVLLAGHRRRIAAQLAGLDSVPVQIAQNLCSTDPEFLPLLASSNLQRAKDTMERAREAALLAQTEDKHEPYRRYLRERARQSSLSGASGEQAVQIEGISKRKKISPAKRPMLDAVLRVLAQNRDWWPLSDMQIHYALLNEKPLRHASKPGSVYSNTRNAYGDLTDLTTRARLAGFVPMEAIADETRTVTQWDVHEGVGSFLQKQINGFLDGYFLNVQRTQPCHIEIVAEKNTVKALVEAVASEFVIKVTTGRGYCSLPPRAQMVQRFKDSGKDRFALIVVSDFDPDGEEICQSFARSLRDDFGVTVETYKAGLTLEQVKKYQLPPTLEAKKTSPNYKKFVERNAEYFAGGLVSAYELEALPTQILQAEIRQTIAALTDFDALREAYAQAETEQISLRALQAATRTFLAEFQSGE